VIFVECTVRYMTSVVFPTMRLWSLLVERVSVMKDLSYPLIPTSEFFVSNRGVGPRFARALTKSMIDHLRDRFSVGSNHEWGVLAQDCTFQWSPSSTPGDVFLGEELR